MLQIFNRARALLAAGLLMAMCVANVANAGALGNLANSMQPGTWAELTPMNGWDSGGILVPYDLGCTVNDYITQYAEKAAWDPVNGRLLFVGQTHGSCYGGRFVIYSEGSNTWSKGPWPSGICESGTPSSPCFSHGYDHNTADPATGDMYYRNYYSTKFFRFRQGSWSTLPPPAMDGVQCCGALEFFPPTSRLVFIDGDFGVWAFDPAASKWTRLANTNNGGPTGLLKLPMISYHNFALYNPVQKALLFGGGTNLYKMSSSGAITTLRNSPVSLGITSAVVAVDPVSGKHVVLTNSGMQEYDMGSDTWKSLSIAMPATLKAGDGVGDGLITAPIPQYGVIIYVKYNNSGSKVYLYKHSPSAPVKTPEPPSDVSAN